MPNNHDRRIYTTLPPKYFDKFMAHCQKIGEKPGNVAKEILRQYLDSKENTSKKLF